MLEEFVTKVDLERGVAVIKTRKTNLFNYINGFRRGLRERGCSIEREAGNQKKHYFYFSYNGGNKHA